MVTARVRLDAVYSMDYLALESRFLLAFVFLLSSLPKLRAPDDFALAVNNYGLLPRRFSAGVARWLPRLELTIAVALLAGFALRAVSLLAGAALAVFATAVTINLVRGRAIDCGCYGSASPKEITWYLVAKDGLLVAGALMVALHPPATLAVPVLNNGVEGPTAEAGVALLIAAAVAVLGESLLFELTRLRRAVEDFSIRFGEAGWQ